MKLLIVINLSFFKPNDVNVLLIVFSDLELLSFIQKIEELSAVNFEKGKFSLQMMESWLNLRIITSAR